MWCKIIKISDNMLFKNEFKMMLEYSRDMVNRKILRSLCQSAQMIYYIRESCDINKQVLCVGCYEDVPFDVLSRTGWDITGIDPVVNTDLSLYVKQNPDIRYSLIFSTSVIEHVKDDKQFIIDMANMLEPGGLCLITCDYNPTWQEGEKLPTTDVRFYTEERLNMIADLIKDYECDLTEVPTWYESTPENLDFEWENIKYAFASISFRKRNAP